MIFWDDFDAEGVGHLTLVADEAGLRHVAFPNDRHPLVIEPGWRRDPAKFTVARNQLADYFAGRRRRFDLPLFPRGTDFQQKVWAVLGEIPYGKTVAYQWVATRIGNPRAVRAVGGAIGRNPLPIVIPCHRVIGRNGQLTGFGGGLAVKEHLLALEQRNA